MFLTLFIPSGSFVVIGMVLATLKANEWKTCASFDRIFKCLGSFFLMGKVASSCASVFLNRKVVFTYVAKHLSALFWDQIYRRLEKAGNGCRNSCLRQRSGTWTMLSNLRTKVHIFYTSNSSACKKSTFMALKAGTWLVACLKAAQERLWSSCREC